MLRGRQAWQLPSRWRLHSHWRTHVSADLLKAFDDTRPERHGLIRWWCISSARAGLIRTIVTAHQPVARWRVPTEVFAVLCWSRSTSGDFGKLISKSLARAKSASGNCRIACPSVDGAADAPSPTRRRPTATTIGNTILAVDRSSEPPRCCRVGDSSYEYTGCREAGCCCGRYSC